jgi:hypothetical protein
MILKNHGGVFWCFPVKLIDFLIVNNFPYVVRKNLVRKVKVSGLSFYFRISKKENTG